MKGVILINMINNENCCFWMHCKSFEWFFLFSLIYSLVMWSDRRICYANLMHSISNIYSLLLIEINRFTRDNFGDSDLHEALRSLNVDFILIVCTKQSMFCWMISHCFYRHPNRNSNTIKVNQVNRGHWESDIDLPVIQTNHTLCMVKGRWTNQKLW